MENKSIMPPSAYYQTERFNGSHKHHIFFGSNRKNSEKYGLFVFLRPELHNLTDKGVHFNKEFDLYLKKIGQQSAMDFYGWTIEQFISVFGKNYL